MFFKTFNPLGKVVLYFITQERHGVSNNSGFAIDAEGELV